MKIVINFFCLVLLPVFVFAQSVGDSVQLRPLLFNHFIEGAVLLKTGAIEKAEMNYNTDNQSIVFIQDGKYLSLTGLEAIDTIYIDDKKFIPIKKTIYEVVTTSSPVTLLVSYSNKITPLVATVDHNGNSKQTASQVSNTVSDTYTARIYRGDFSVEFIRQFWLRKGKEMNKFNNEKQVVKVFPSMEVEIAKFINENKTNFSNPNDMVSLVSFCSEHKK